MSVAAAGARMPVAPWSPSTSITARGGDLYSSIMERPDSERPDYMGAFGWTILTVLTYLAITFAFIGTGAVLWIFFGDTGSSD
jgi:hypothetical protein